MTSCHRLLAAALILAAAPSFAQPAIGYSDPEDLDALLAYRLPDWGWSEWDGRLYFRGSGASSTDQSIGRHDLDLATDATWVRQGEQLSWYLSAGSRMLLSVDNVDNSSGESDQDRFGTEQDVIGNVRRYLGGSSVYLLGRGGIAWDYDQSRSRTTGQDVPTTRYSRDVNLRAGVGLGIGRVRNVTPLITAERISERLVALGRPALTRAQVQAVAEALVRRDGYVENYERFQRFFWEAVLAPVLDPARPLAPYEVLYLQDVEREQSDLRREGMDFELGANWRENNTNLDLGSASGSVGMVSRPHAWNVSAATTWAHNLSLDTQLTVDAYVVNEWVDATEGDERRTWGSLNASWLRNVSDRHRLAIEARVLGDYREDQTGRIRRYATESLQISDRIWVEDSLALQPYATLDYITASSSDGSHGDPRTTWSYGVTVQYYFDSAIF